METDTFQFFLQNQANSNYYDNINSVYRYIHNLYRCIWLVRDYMIHIHNLDQPDTDIYTLHLDIDDLYFLVPFRSTI